ncbi:hypothetical protein AB0J52_39235 [Spirillospora sp. NPDC049652]
MIAAVDLYWASGGGVGTNPRYAGELDAPARMLSIGDAFWALAGAASAWVLLGRMARLPLWLPVATAFVASGSLVGWGGWRMVLVLLRPGGTEPHALPSVAVAVDAVSVAAGLALAVHLFRAVRGRSSGLLQDPR